MRFLKYINVISFRNKITKKFYYQIPEPEHKEEMKNKTNTFEETKKMMIADVICFLSEN